MRMCQREGCVNVLCDHVWVCEKQEVLITCSLSQPSVPAYSHNCLRFTMPRQNRLWFILICKQLSN